MSNYLSIQCYCSKHKKPVEITWPNWFRKVRHPSCMCDDIINLNGSEEIECKIVNWILFI